MVHLGKHGKYHLRREFARASEGRGGERGSAIAGACDNIEMCLRWRPGHGMVRSIRALEITRDFHDRGNWP